MDHLTCRRNGITVAYRGPVRPQQLTPGRPYIGHGSLIEAAERAAPYRPGRFPGGVEVRVVDAPIKGVDGNLRHTCGTQLTVADAWRRHLLKPGEQIGQQIS